MSTDDAKIFDHLKHKMEFVSDVQLMGWLEISKPSLSGIRTGRLPMGDTIRFQILNKWWAELRPALVGLTNRDTASSNAASVAARKIHTFSSKEILPIVHLHLKERGKAVPVETNVGTSGSAPEDAELLEAYKVFRGCTTDAELADVLGMKRQSISMVRSGRNGLGPIPLLKIFEDVSGLNDLGLQAAVK